jgi:hypothetical protein
MTDTEILTCFGCVHLTHDKYSDGSITYGCAFCPGLIKGESSMYDDDDPIRCDKYSITPPVSSV